MAEKDNKGLIGFDPLAWMEEETATEQDTTKEPVDEADESSEAVIENEMTSNKLTLDATLNIQNVTHLYEQLLALIAVQNKIEIDASAVMSIDTASLQLFIVLKQTSIKLGKEIIFDFPSDKFIESAELLGLAEMLEIDQAAAGLF